MMKLHQLHYIKIRCPDLTLSNFIEMEAHKGNKCCFQRRCPGPASAGSVFQCLVDTRAGTLQSHPFLSSLFPAPSPNQADWKCVFLMVSYGSFPFPCIYHHFSLFTRLLSHAWPCVPMAFLLLLHRGWRRVCPALLPNLLSYSRGWGVQGPKACDSTGQAETMQLETGERSLRGVKNHNMKIKLVSCSLQDIPLLFSATLRTRDLNASK